MRLILRSLALALLVPTVATIDACDSSTPNPTTPTSNVPGTDAAPPPAAGGTGAFGIVTVNGKQKMYLPQQNIIFDEDSGTSAGVISVVDVSATAPANRDSSVSGASPAAPALIKNVTLPPVLLDGGDSPDDQYASATGGDASIVVAVSKTCHTVWFIDPVKDVVTGSLVLDSTYGQSAFSGGGGYVTGVAVDATHNRAILSVWNGFVIIDLAAQAIVATISSPPSENFGYDSITQRIYSPFYSCTQSSSDTGTPASCNDPKGPDGVTVMTDGLNVIDLADPDHPVYTYELPATDAASGASDPNFPVGSEPDSAAVDPTTGVVVVPSEGDDFQTVIDMSKAVFDKTTKTVTAPSHIIDTGVTSGLDAVAIEPNSHLALWETEFESQVAAADLTLANGGNEAWAYATMPELPDGTTFENIGDPHGLAATTALIGGQPVGLVVDESLHWIGRISFAQIANQALGDGGVDLDPGSVISADASIGVAGIAPYVTYLDTTTLE